jgi:hypothetical protein
MDNQKSLKKREDKKEISTATPKEITLEEVAEVLSLTIKDDNSNKKIVFLAMLSAYTDQSQINVSLNAPSSTGKTYLVKEIAELFPDDDKIERSGASPTSFFYGEGVENKERKAKIVQLGRKILLFYEQPNPALQERLRPLLSHDKKEIIYALTNKKGGRNQTDTIILEGFPATIFCSAGLRLDEQEATRAILISPEATEAKIKQAIHLRAKRSGNESKFADWLEKQPERTALKDRIAAIRSEHIDEVLISDTDIVTIEERFLDMIHVLKPRNQRDVDHLLQLIKVIALLNVWYRTQPDGTIMAIQSDIDQAFNLWDKFFKSQNLGISPAVLDVYEKYIVPAYMAKYEAAGEDERISLSSGDIGLTPQELSAYYMKEEDTALNNDHLRKQILPQLQSAGLIELEKPNVVKDSWSFERKSEPDRRTRHIFPKLLTDDEKKYIGNMGMDNTPRVDGKSVQEFLDEIPD